MIFAFSSESGSDSSSTSQMVVKMIYDFLRIFIKNIDYSKFYNLAITPVRKLAHFSEFGLLGVMAYLNVKEYIKNNWIKYAFIFCAIYALSDEIHQLFVANRNCSLIDVTIDSLGSLCGILIIHFITRKWIKDL